MSEIAIERATTDDVSSKYLDTASSGDLFQKVTSQLVGVFRARGCAFPIAEEMAQNVTEELRARVGEVLRRPGLKATWVSGVIQTADFTLDLERHIFWRGDKEVHLSPKEFDVLALMDEECGHSSAPCEASSVSLGPGVWG